MVDHQSIPSSICNSRLTGKPRSDGVETSEHTGTRADVHCGFLEAGEPRMDLVFRSILHCHLTEKASHESDKAWVDVVVALKIVVYHHLPTHRRWNHL